MTWSLARPGIHMGLKAESQTDVATAGGALPAVDAVLLDRVSAGDETAFGQIADRHYAVVFRVASRVLGDPAEAEDVTQEAFVRLWRDPGVVRNPAALRSWLIQVGRNLAIR